MAISSAGVGSGLDVNNIISQLMALEQRPLTALATKEARYQAQLSAYGSLKGAMSAFQSTVAGLATPGKFTALVAALGDTTIGTVSAASTAQAGTYSLEVKNLAQAQKLASKAFTSTDTNIGTGTLTIAFGTYNADTHTANPAKSPVTVTIGAGQGSLAGIRDAINAANAGVTAGLVNDGTGFKLTISSKETGVENAIRITVADVDGQNTDNAGLSQLAFDARTTSGVMNLSETVAAKSAVAVIDGITVTKATNTFTDAIPGVTLNLLKTNVGTATTLTVARDVGGVQTALQSFVKSFNDLNKTITDLSKYDAVNKKASILTGEPTVRAIQSQMRAVLNAVSGSAGGGVSTLSDVGISFQLDGTLKLDSAKLTAALNDPTKDVASLFAAVAKPTDTSIKLTGTPTLARPGGYPVVVTQAATQGTAVGDHDARGNDLKIQTGSDDVLTLSVDGVAISVTLAPATYATAAALAAEIQTKVNASSALVSAGRSVLVTESGGFMKITSAQYGSTSSVNVTGGNGKTAIFGNSAHTAGVDVAGTIGGVTATGSGTTLTGTGAAQGLVVTVTGSTTGSRGSIAYSQGYAYTLDKLFGKMLAADNLVDGRMSGITRSIDDLGDRREALGTRLVSVERRLRNQFSTLDSVLSSMQQTSAFLSQQLANLP